jgi:S1/P1 Nuclease
MIGHGLLRQAGRQSSQRTAILPTGLHALLAVLALLVPIATQAFGAQGHRVTGEIAARLLPVAVLDEVERLAGSRDLGLLANVADTDRANLAARYGDSARWHYDDRLVCHPDLPAVDYCPRGNCASAAITRLSAVLADRSRADAERRDALLFLIHIVGDIHQPLHAADNNDRGGNAVRVSWSGNRSLPLHAAWDVEFVRLALDGRTPARAAGEWLERFRTDVATWQRGSVDSWMAESYARAVDEAYGPLPGWQCDVAATGTVVLPAAYVDHAVKIMPGLLTEAGVRIARVLSDALGPNVHR